MCIVYAIAVFIKLQIDAMLLLNACVRLYTLNNYLYNIIIIILHNMHHRLLSIQSRNDVQNELHTVRGSVGSALAVRQTGLLDDPMDKLADLL